MQNKKTLNYSNNESQELFEEFTILLGQITSEVEEKNKRIIFLENELAKYNSLKYLLKKSFLKFLKYPMNIKDKFIKHRI